MTEYLINSAPLFSICISVLLGIFFCVKHLERRNNLWLRISLFSLALLGVTALYGFLFFVVEGIVFSYLQACFYIILCVVAVLVNYACFRAPVTELLFFSSIGLVFRFLGVKIARLLLLFLTFNGFSNDKLAAEIIVFIITAVVYLILWLSLFRNINQTQKTLDKIFWFLYPIIVVVAFLLKLAEISVEATDASYCMFLYFCEILYGLVMFFVYYALLRQGMADKEISILKQLWIEDRKRYELQKETIDIINIKCHDLRHQVRNIRKTGHISEKAMEEIENSIYIYESVVKTKNEVLDVILSNMYLRCKKNDVQLTCMADGESIKFMDEMDVYSLFGNLLENALEYEQTVIPKENRFISLTVKKTENSVVVHGENYYPDTAVLTDGIIATNKKDKNYHGFGMKSMKKITEKYNGSFEVLIADDMFQVTMVFPLSNESTLKEELT